MSKQPVLDEMDCPQATRVAVDEHTLTVDLEDGRTISIPVEWYPRLAHSTMEERQQFTISFSGIHWEEIDEDISIKAIILGAKSGESAKSLQWYFAQRAKGEKPWLEPGYVMPSLNDKESGETAHAANTGS